MALPEPNDILDSLMEPGLLLLVELLGALLGHRTFGQLLQLVLGTGGDFILVHLLQQGGLQGHDVSHARVLVRIPLGQEQR